MVGPQRGSRDRERIPVDERLVMPETRYEIIDGEVEFVAPADEPHGSRHSKTSALLEAYVAPGYDVASDMLTRTSKKDDFAPDASVFPSERDPETGGRRLEELAFEVVSTERLSRAGQKAAKLTARGVRRVFAIDVERRRVLSWSTETGAWQMLAPGDVIVDKTLALPLAIDALVGTASEDDAISRAMLAKGTPAIRDALAKERARGQAAGRAAGLAQGFSQGKATALLAILAARQLPVSDEEARIIRETSDERTLDRWIRAAVTCTTLAELDLVPRAEKKRRAGAPKKNRKAATAKKKPRARVRNKH